MNDSNDLTPRQREALIDRLDELRGGVLSRDYIRLSVNRADRPWVIRLATETTKGDAPDE